VKNFYTLFFVTFIILICISAGYYYTVFRSEPNPLPEEPQLKEDPLQLLSHRLIDLQIKKNFWKNKIKLADQDHYNLFIDLSESMVTLEISGIIAHSSTVSNFEVSENFQSLNRNEQIVKMLQEPFHLMEEWASVPKDPIRIKDISGFEWNPDSLNFLPTEVDTDYVFLVLKCSRDLTVMISQRAITGKMPTYIISDHLTKYSNIININDRTQKLPFSDLLQKNWLGIEIARSDAIALFRALSDETLLTLCI
jgi:hypothetical protein